MSDSGNGEQSDDKANDSSATAESDSDDSDGRDTESTLSDADSSMDSNDVVVESPGKQQPDEADPTAPFSQSDDELAAESLAALRERVERKYDFDDFGPAQMAEMSADEWSAAFDPDAWVTGNTLLDRVEADLKARIADRDVFAVIERVDDEPPRLVAYSDTSYAIVYPDGSVEGDGAVLHDVKPSVALASMPEYEVPTEGEESGLPHPTEVDGGTSQIGNWMLQVVAGTLLIAGVALLGAVFVTDLGGATIVAIGVGGVFVILAFGLLFAVANARLSARYRADEFRERLREAGVGRDDRPDFVPIEADDSIRRTEGTNGERTEENVD